jgi:PPOX class probable F420-dependent enzyme
VSVPERTIIEFLQGRYIASLATHRADGSAHVTPIWYLFEDGAFYFPTGPHTVKARNVRARPQASVMVDSRGPGPLRAASTSGPATVLDADRARAFNERCWARYVTAAGRADPGVGGILERYDSVCIKVTPTRWIWSDMGAVFEGKLEDTALVLPLSP